MSGADGVISVPDDIIGVPAGFAQKVFVATCVVLKIPPASLRGKPGGRIGQPFTAG